MGGVVVDHVTPEMAIFREESFGPQVCITRVDGVDEAVRVARWITVQLGPRHYPL
jgi:acyl-CoA reductase-like NAD-dependent aldehyde dehydrogenase